MSLTVSGILPVKIIYNSDVDVTDVLAVGKYHRDIFQGEVEARCGTKAFGKELSRHHPQ